MNERTNITDKGYSYGGKDYVYETRVNPVTNVPYQVAIEKPATTPTIQTTNAQRNADVQTQVKYDALTKAKGLATTPTITGTTTPTTTETPTTTTSTATPKKPEDAISFYYAQGITDPYQIYSKILNSNDATVDYNTVVKTLDTLKGDQKLTAESGYASQLRALDEDRIKVQQQFDEMKKNLSEENKRAIDSITAKFNVRRETLKQNMANLMGVHEKQGYATGGNRYTQMQQAGILTNDENNLVARLGELDSQEQIALLEASQAKSKGDWDNLSNTLNQFDKINDNRVAILKNLSTLAETTNKKLEAEKKATEKAKLMGFTNVGAYAKSLAPAYAQETLSMNDAQLDEYIKTKAEELGIDVTVLKSAVLEKRTALLKKTATGGKSTSKATKANFYADVEELIKNKASLGGIPVVDVNGFINPQAFEKIVQAGARVGATREQIANAYKAKLYGGSGAIKNYKAYNLK